jgi:glycosyltransferase involved in cell wall biosynthesis
MSERNAPTFDLIMCTLGRTAEPRRLVESLAGQTWQDFRLIAVDQNRDHRLEATIAEFHADVPSLHLRSLVGLSKGRNTGLRHVTADIVSFPDDDCWYPPDLLGRVARFLDAHPEVDGVHGRSVDAQNRPTGGRADLHAGLMTRYNLWRRVGSYMLFVRRRVVEATGDFDEMLGLGSPGPWGAGEDLDYVHRCLVLNLSLYYDPTLLVYHPKRRERSPRPSAKDGYQYGMGLGRALRKSRMPVWFSAYLCFRAFAAALLGLISMKPTWARFHWAVGRGRLRGWLLSPSPARDVVGTG